MDTSMDILSTEYDNLKLNVDTLEKDLESKNQLIYDLKKQITVATALEGDYLQEIEILQSNDNCEVIELQKRVKQLEDGIVSFRHSSNAELLRKTELIESLRNEVTEVSKNACKDEFKERKFNTFDTDIERNAELKEEVKILSSALLEMQASIDNLQMQNVNLEETNNDFLMELEHAKQNFQCKMLELNEAKKLIHNLQEDSFIIKLELESMKNKPLDAAKKGNSLFAEVEDSRIKTQQNIQQIKKKYAELKRDVCNKLNQMTTLRARNTELSKQLNFIKSCDEEYEKAIEAYKVKVAALESSVEEYKKETWKDQKFTGKDLPSYSVEFANTALGREWNDGNKARDELNSESKKKLERFINIKNANAEMREWRRKVLQLKIKVEEFENTILEMQLQNSPTNIPELESLNDFSKQKIPSSSTSNCPENKPKLTIENVLMCATVDIRKRGNPDDKCIIQQEKPNKLVALHSELKIEKLESHLLDREANPTEIQTQSESTSYYSQMKDVTLYVKKENTDQCNSNQDEQSKTLILDNINTSEKLHSASFEPTKEFLEPKKFDLSIVEMIENDIELRNQSNIDQSIMKHQSARSESVIIVENVCGIQLLKCTSHNNSAEPAMQNMSALSSLKMEFDQDEQNKTLILENLTGNEILNSTSFEAKIELLEPKMLTTKTEDTVETRNQSNLDQSIMDHQNYHNESVIIVENVCGIQLLKGTSHNNSAEPAVQNMSALSSLKMEVDQDEQSKTLILENLTGNEILNSTSFEAKIELLEPKMLTTKTEDTVETRNQSNLDQSIMDHQNYHNESVIIVENVCGIQLLKGTSHNNSAEPAVQNMSALSSLKMEVDQDEQSKTLILENLTGNEILNSTSFEAKIELLEPKMLTTKTEDTVETRNQSNLDQSIMDHQNYHNESVPIVENVCGIQLLKCTSHNNSAEPAVQNMSALSSLKMEVDQDEQSKILILENLTGNEILNSTSFEAKLELLKLTMLESNMQDAVETKNQSNVDQNVIEPQDVENMSGIQLLDSTSYNVSAEPTKLKSSLKLKSNLKFTESSNNDRNNYDGTNITDDQKQLPNENYGTKSIKQIEFSNYTPQKTAQNNWDNDNVSKPIAESQTQDNLFDDIELKKSTCKKSYVANTGHTPAAHQQFRSRINSVREQNTGIPQNINNAGHTPAVHQKFRSRINSVKEQSTGIPQLNINNAGRTPVTCQKWDLPNTPAGESSAKKPLESGKKALKSKTSIPLPTGRKLN